MENVPRSRGIAACRARGGASKGTCRGAHSRRPLRGPCAHIIKMTVKLLDPRIDRRRQREIDGLGPKGREMSMRVVVVVVVVVVVIAKVVDDMASMVVVRGQDDVRLCARNGIIAADTGSPIGRNHPNGVLWAIGSARGRRAGTVRLGSDVRRCELRRCLGLVPRVARFCIRRHLCHNVIDWRRWQCAGCRDGVPCDSAAAAPGRPRRR
jgi:hypothetical protein